MRYGSVCSGIEAATAAWHPLGWEPSFFSEIEKFPRAVLQHHYPNVPLWGDFTTIRPRFLRRLNIEPIDLLFAGTPCQTFSVAGLREGLDDDRGNLAIEYLKLAKRLRPRWVGWENVPGVLSSNGGRDFGSFLGGLVELGYGFAYRVLDAQYFGVPQRRRRVYVVGYLGDWRPPAAVLFEQESLRRNPPPSRETRQDIAGTLSSRTSGGGGLGTDFDLAGGVQVAYGGNNTSGAIATATAVNASGSRRYDFESETFITSALDASYGRLQGCSGQDLNHGHSHLVTCAHGIQDLDIKTNLAHTRVRNNGQENAILFDTTQITSLNNRSNPNPGDPSHTLSAAAHPPTLVDSAVRRLTPIECERLQGFEDNYTAIPWRGKPAELCPDGPRYKAIGNSMAVPVMRWLGQRIEMVDKLLKELVILQSP